MACFPGSEVNPPAEPSLTIKRQRNKQLPDIDFTKALEEEMSDLFAPPKNPKSLLLPANRAICSTKLPEDCHYQPEDLVKLFLLPNVKVIFFAIIGIDVFPSKWYSFFFLICSFGCSALEGEAGSPQVTNLFLVIKIIDDPINKLEYPFFYRSFALFFVKNCAIDI